MTVGTISDGFVCKIDDGQHSASDCPAAPHPVPRLRSLATAPATYDGAAELDEGLTIVLAGLRSQLRT